MSKVIAVPASYDTIRRASSSC